MAYFVVNSIDLSKYVAKLVVGTKHNYTAQSNASGDSIVDYINNKRTIKVEIIPLEEKDFRVVLNAITFNSTVSYRNPLTGELSSANCIIDNNDIDYYTFQQNKVMYKKMSLTFNEL